MIVSVLFNLERLQALMNINEHPTEVLLFALENQKADSTNKRNRGVIGLVG